METVDLHIHTTASDGRLTPTQMVRFLARQGLKVVSITDHDTVDGLAEALEASGAFPDMELIPGVELSCDVPGSEVHLLGYFVDYRDMQFLRVLERFRNGRVIRAKLMLEKLASMNMKVEWARVAELAGDGAVGRPHIAQAMVEKGYVASFREAFDKYIGRNGPAYVEREKLTPVDAVRLISRVGGVAVLAHPRDIPCLTSTIWELLPEGLAGMEVYYGDYSGDTVRSLKQIADTFALVPCGGSDYHALNVPGEVLPGTVGPPMESVLALKRLWEERSQAQAAARRSKG